MMTRTLSLEANIMINPDRSPQLNKFKFFKAVAKFQGFQKFWAWNGLNWNYLKSYFFSIAVFFQYCLLCILDHSMKLLRAGSQLSTYGKSTWRLYALRIYQIQEHGLWFQFIYLLIFSKFFDKAKAKKCVSVLIYDNYPTKYFLVV